MLRALLLAAIAAIVACAGCSPSYRAGVDERPGQTLSATSLATANLAPTSSPGTLPYTPPTAPVVAPSAPDITVADLSPSAHGRPATGSSATSPSADATISIDLYRAGAFASQKTTYYCVPASIEIMLNFMSDSPPDTTRARQDALYAKTRDDLIQPYWGKGAQPEGWATVLSDEDAGTYELGIRTNATQALHVAAKQLWATGRPVGLLVWRGFHAWVMSGFTSIGDPATTDSFRVTGVFVEDPWYPRISRTYGRGQAPDTYLSTTKLARFFLPYDQHGEGGLDKDGRYVVVVPVSVP